MTLFEKAKTKIQLNKDEALDLALEMLSHLLNGGKYDLNEMADRIADIHDAALYGRFYREPLPPRQLKDIPGR